MKKLDDQLAKIIVPVVLVTAALVWSYYQTFLGLTTLWTTDPNYSQGFLIPVLAAGLLWFRCRHECPSAQPKIGWGLALVAVALLLRCLSGYFYISGLDHLSIIVILCGLCLLAGGWPWLRLCWPSIFLLFFMFPIPNAVGGNELVAGLQAIATKGSTYLLQSFGMVAMYEGNVILLSSTELGVVEACSGLRMLMVFCALCFVTAIVIQTGWVRKVLIFLSAVPIAIFSNILRITLAGLASELLSTEAGYFVFHDLAAWLLVPFGFLMLGLEMYILSKIIVTQSPHSATG